MGEVHYMISEAAKRVCVETHVLRYWEEELQLTIGRTEMGHRYYTEDDIQLFNCIKELKEQGLLLRDLKNLIPEMLQTRQTLHAKKEEALSVQEPEQAAKELVQEPEQETGQDSELHKALLENNKVLEASISLAVSKAVVSEMKLLFLAKEHLEEERYKKLDSLIRQQQALRRESAQSATLKGLRKIFVGS